MSTHPFPTDPLDRMEIYLTNREAVQRRMGFTSMADDYAAQLTALKDLRAALAQYLALSSIDGRAERQALRAKLAAFLPKS